MSQPNEIYYCAGCGRVATQAQGPESLTAQGCEGTHQRYVRADLLDRLLNATHEHAMSVERKVSKDAWSRANQALYDVMIEVKEMLGMVEP